MHRRTPSRYLSLLPVLLGALALAGCVTPPQPTPTSTPPATPSATPTAEPDAVAASIVILPEALEIQDAGGDALGTLEYESDGEAFIAALTEFIGPAASTQEFEGDLHFPPSIAHSWNGLTVTVWEPGGPLLGVAVEATAETIPGEISLTTAEGYQVGDDCMSIATDEGASMIWSTEGQCYIGVDFGPELGAAEVEGYPNANTVSLFGTPSVSVIRAPDNLGVAKA